MAPRAGPDLRAGPGPLAIPARRQRGRSRATSRQQRRAGGAEGVRAGENTLWPRPCLWPRLFQLGDCARGVVWAWSVWSGSAPRPAQSGPRGTPPQRRDSPGITPGQYRDNAVTTPGEHRDNARTIPDCPGRPEQGRVVGSCSPALLWCGWGWRLQGMAQLGGSLDVLEGREALQGGWKDRGQWCEVQQGQGPGPAALGVQQSPAAPGWGRRRGRRVCKAARRKRTWGRGQQRLDMSQVSPRGQEGQWHLA